MNFFLIYLIFYQITLTTSISYYGDIPIRDYLRKFCSSKSWKPNLILFENYQNLIHNNDNLHRFLLNLKCAHAHDNFDINDNDNNSLINYYNVCARNFNRKIQIIFNIDNKNVKSLKNFNNLLKILSTFYEKCICCLPLIILINVSIENLIQWTTAALDNFLPTDFQSILVDKNNQNSNSVLHIRPILNGCVRVDKIFVPQSKLDFEKLKVGFRNCDLSAASLNISVNHNLPFCDISTDPQTGQIQTGYSLEMQILDAFKNRFNFTANLIDAKQDWGILVGGTTWTGVMGHVLNGTSAMGMCAISQTKARQKYLDFTNYIYLNALTFVSRSPGLESSKWIIASPFPSVIWALILVCLIGQSLILYIVRRKEKGSNANFSEIVQNLFVVLVNQSSQTSHHNSTNFTRLIFAFWILSALILSNAYSSSFYSILIVPEYERPIDTIDDLIKVARKDTRHIVMNGRSIYWYDITNSGPDNFVYYEVAKHLNRTKRAMVTKPTEIPLLDKDRKILVIDNRMFLATDRFLHANQPLHIASENLAPDYISLLLPKRSPLIPPFNMLITRMHNMGLISKWIANTFLRLSSANKAIYPIGGMNTLYENPNGARSSQTGNKLSIWDLRSVFYVWSIGVGVAMGVFVLEIVKLKFVCK